MALLIAVAIQYCFQCENFESRKQFEEGEVCRKRPRKNGDMYRERRKGHSTGGSNGGK